MSEVEKKILGIFQAAIQNKVSDLHFATGVPPAFRMRDGVTPINVPAFTEEDMNALCNILIQDPEIKKDLKKVHDLDGSYDCAGLGRFRFNIFRHKTHLGAVLRVITNKVPTIEELNLPTVLKTIAEANRGLILVTGATGSGKSSTLAAMIDHINNTQACHILTIEDPIEFVHQQKKSRISQREVGRDTDSFSSALKSALRQDPDVILVGEMRDIETLDIALKAAETGHLVFSTVHTTDAIKTIGRLISMYPADEQQAVRLRFADNIHATVSQRLVNSTDKKTKVAAQEIMVSNLAIRDCIANEKKTGEMNMFIENGHEILGSQTFDQHLSILVRKKLISVEDAMASATNPADFQRNLAFGEGGGGGDEGALNIQMEERDADVVGNKTSLIDTQSSLNKTQSTGTATTPTAAPGAAPAARPVAGVTPMPKAPPKIPKLPKAS